MNHFIYSLISDSMNSHNSSYRQQYQEHEKQVVGRVSQKLHRHNRLHHWQKVWRSYRCTNQAAKREPSADFNTYYWIR